MINLEDYGPKGSKSRDVTVIRHIDKYPPGIKPDIDGYHIVKLAGLILQGAHVPASKSIETPSIVDTLSVNKQTYFFATCPYMQLRVMYKGWLITYKAILGQSKFDGNVILRWMGCNDINDAIGLDWEGVMPLQYGDRNASLIVPNIIQMRRDLGL